MAMRGVVIVGVLLLGCGAVEPDDGLGDTSGGTTGGDVATSNDDATATQGMSSTTGNATGVSASTTSPSDTGTSTTTGADPTASATEPGTSTTTGADPSDTTTASSETGGPIVECGIEIDPAGGNYEAGCGCDTCDLYYTDLDYDAFEEIVDECDCLCEAAGCGTNSNEAVAAAEGGEGEASSG